MNSAITEQEFWDHVQSVSAEVDDVLALFHTYEEILRLGSEDAVFRAFNANAMFWNVQKVSLQTTIFVALNRLFETDPNALSIHGSSTRLWPIPNFSLKTLCERGRVT